MAMMIVRVRRRRRRSPPPTAAAAVTTGNSVPSSVPLGPTVTSGFVAREYKI